jgi:hypothetical protein
MQWLSSLHVDPYKVRMFRKGQRVFSENAKREARQYDNDSMMVTLRQYDGDTATVRWWLQQCDGKYDGDTQAVDGGTTAVRWWAHCHTRTVVLFILINNSFVLSDSYPACCQFEKSYG